MRTSASSPLYRRRARPRFFLPLDQQLRNPNFAQLLVMAKDEAAREPADRQAAHDTREDFPSIRTKVHRVVPGTADGMARADAGDGPDRKEVRRIADR